MSATRSKLSVMLGLKLDISRFRSGPYKSRVRSFALNFITADLKFTRSHLLLCLLSFLTKQSFSIMYLAFIITGGIG